MNTPEYLSATWKWRDPTPADWQIASRLIAMSDRAAAYILSFDRVCQLTWMTPFIQEW
jgi:hypothetical protein